MRLIKRGYIVFVIVVAISYFFPNIVYVTTKVGIVQAESEKSFFGVSIDFSDEWFQLGSNKSILRFILYKDGKNEKEITYIKKNWLNPWSSQFIVISQINKESVIDCSGQNKISFSSYKPENEVTSAMLKINNTYTLRVPKLNLIFTSNNISSFDALQYISCN